MTEDSLTAAAADLGHELAAITEIEVLPADELCEMLRDVADGIEQAVESDESSS